MSALKLVELCAAKRLTLAVAESCTGGLLSAAITDVPGASAVFGRGFITYSNEAKTEMLGVDPALIAAHGAVNEEVARAMAEGALRSARADIAAAVTGIAGPGGGSAEKPVGLVFISAARKGKTRCGRHQFPGGRSEVRRAAVREALAMLYNIACKF